MKRVNWLVIAAVIVSSPPALAQSDDREPGHQQASSWYARVGVLDAIYQPSATIATSGQAIPGATADVSNNLMLMVDISYDVTQASSIQMMVGTPPNPTVTGEGTIASPGDLGAVRYGPVFLTGTYQARRVCRPHVGAGVVYAIILPNHDRAVSDLIVW